MPTMQLNMPLES